MLAFAPLALPVRAPPQERRASHEGMVSVGRNLYSVPDTTRRRVFDVHVLADEVRIFEDGALVALSHSRWRDARQKRLDPRASKIVQLLPASPLQFLSPRRSRARATTRRGARSIFYAAVGTTASRAALGGLEVSAPAVIEHVKASLVALKMPRALEILDVTLRGIERGEIGTVEAIDALLTEELTIRENRRVKMAVQMAKHHRRSKPSQGFDFAFQPSLDKNRILAASLDCSSSIAPKPCIS